MSFYVYQRKLGSQSTIRIYTNKLLCDSGYRNQAFESTTPTAPPLKKHLELIKLSSIKLILVQVSSCSNTGSIRDDPYWISRKNNLELIELSSINKVSLVQVSSCSNTGSIRDDPYWISRKNSLELIELSSINKVNFSSGFFL